MEKKILRKIDLLTADILDAEERIKEALTVSEEITVKMELQGLLVATRVLFELLEE